MSMFLKRWYFKCFGISEPVASGPRETMLSIPFSLLSLLISFRFLLIAEASGALQVADLDPDRQWQVTSVAIEGNSQFSNSQLQGEMVTIPRAWYFPWRPRPTFDPVAFLADIERLQRFYRAQGYYEARVEYALDAESAGGLMQVHISIHEGEPVRVERILLAVSDDTSLAPALEELRPELPLSEGDLFVEERYRNSEARIKQLFLELHRGRVKVLRQATVFADRHMAEVQYAVEVGPSTVFGETTVEGTQAVEPALVTRELTYKAGEPFSARAIDTSRKNIEKLDIFSMVRLLEEESPNDSSIIPVRVKVNEKPLREWQAGIGYATEDGVRGQVRWRHNNWLGGGRRLEVQARLSSLSRQIEVSFLQPHALGRDNRFSLTFRPQQLDEPGYLLNATRLQARFERQFTPMFSGFVGLRVEYDRLNNVAASTIRALSEFQRNGTLVGAAWGVLWSSVDDPLNATRGGLVSLTADHVGGVLGGDFSFAKFQGEARRYMSITQRTVLAGRVKFGFAESFGRSQDVPLFERLYAGGLNSVRGYDRHRLGPISEANDPIGGRSLLEGAIELRRQLTDKIGGTLFLDFGQVSLHSFEVQRLEFAAGVGALYTSPVGPVLLALGFPFDPPHGEQPWQVHFSIGQFF